MSWEKCENATKINFLEIIFFCKNIKIIKKIFLPKLWQIILLNFFDFKEFFFFLSLTFCFYKK